MRLLSKIAIPVLAGLIFFGCSDMVNDPVDISNNENPTLQKGGQKSSASVQLAEGPPSAGNTIVAIATSDPNFSTLVEAVTAAGFVDLLSGNRQFTVFAPTNAAFESTAEVLGLTVPELVTFLVDNDLLGTVLSYHVSPGNKKSNNVLNSGRVNTLEGSFIFLGENGNLGNPATGYNSGLVAADIRASNGTIHVIDFVLLPPALEPFLP